MLKSATQLWGVQQNDIAAFDPIVNLLIGACSVELEKVYNEIHSSNTRVLERLSKLLLPEVNKNTLPAHGILHAAPYETGAQVNKFYQFSYSKKIATRESSIRENSRDIYFSPVADYRLVKGELKFLATNTGLYTIDNLLYKNKAAKCVNSRVNTKFLWIGLDLEENINEIDELVFYFDWINNPLRDRYLEYLPFTRWSCRNTSLDFTNSIISSSSGKEVEKNFNYNSEFVTTQNIISYYNKRFISVNIPGTLKEGFDIKEKYPEDFKLLYEAKGLEQIKDKLVWIKVLFPPFVTDEAIDQLTCQLNCFPVMNRKFNELIFRLYDGFNIIPLKEKNDEASFFSVEGVKSSDGKPYISTNLSALNELNNGNYVIRKGGVQRFDERLAREYLTYMIDLLRDESAAFSVYGQEMLSSNLKELNQLFALIEQKIQRDTTSENTVDYLILKSQLKQDNVHVEYWSTLGEFANAIRVGTDFSIYYGDSLDASQITLISETVGGRNELTSSEMLSSFKQALGSRERIVTVADIRNLCYSELGNLIREVRVKKSYVVDSKSKTGFQKILQIEIVPTNAGIVEDDEWNLHKLKLEAHIKNASFAGMPVEVIIVQ